MSEQNEMTFVQKLENFWYHYKWQTIIGVFFLVTITVCTVQCARNSDADVMIMYAGNYAVADSYREGSLENLMSEDYNGDGEKRCDVFQLVLNIVERGGEYEYYDAVGQNEELQRLEIEFYSGQSVIYVLHPFIYEQYKNVMADLSDVLENVPEDAMYDSKALKISSLDAYANTTLGFYPGECVICIRNMRKEDNLITKADKPEYYSANVRFMNELVSYTAE